MYFFTYPGVHGTRDSTILDVSCQLVYFPASASASSSFSICCSSLFCRTFLLHFSSNYFEYHQQQQQARTVTVSLSLCPSVCPAVRLSNALSTSAPVKALSQSRVAFCTDLNLSPLSHFSLPDCLLMVIAMAAVGAVSGAGTATVEAVAGALCIMAAAAALT